MVGGGNTPTNGLETSGNCLEQIFKNRQEKSDFSFSSRKFFNFFKNSFKP